jgi:threonine dehydratase
MDFLREVQDAERRIAGRVRETPVERSHHLSELACCRVWLKQENLQRTGSFKPRGAMSKLLSLDDDERARGVVAASSGNHGAAVACGAAEADCPALIFVPESCARAKVEAIRAWGAEVRLAGDDSVRAEITAREHAREHGLIYLSPYNDPLVVAGQGTIGRELERQLERIDAIFIALGGGGLISGIGGYLKAAGHDVRMVACSPANSPVMHESLRAGRILEMESKPTLSDGTAGGVERDSITFDLCRQIVDDSLVVTEEEIRDGVRAIVEHEHVLVEGAAGVAVAGFLQQRERHVDRDVVILLCGANIDAGVLKSIL